MKILALLLITVLQPTLALAGTSLMEGIQIAEHKNWETIRNNLPAIEAEGELGNVEAQMFLGNLYEYGGAVTADSTEEMKWYRKAADQGNPEAQYEIGRLYAGGSGVPADHAEALKWYLMAAKRLNASAQRELVRVYENAEGTRQDLVQAYMWCVIVEGDKADSYGLNELENKMTHQQIEEAKSLAAEWKPTQVPILSKDEIPPEGLIPDQTTAIAVARAILTTKYGAVAVFGEEPLQAVSEGDNWIIRGWNKDRMERRMKIDISKFNGGVIRISYGE